MNNSTLCLGDAVSLFDSLKPPKFQLPSLNSFSDKVKELILQLDNAIKLAFLQVKKFV